MGENRFFWPQELLDEWIVDEKIALDGATLTITSEDRTYEVQQAVYFEADVGDGSDGHGLVGRVKEIATLEEMGAEHYMDSVLIEDSAYQVVPGFTGMPLCAQAQEAPAAAAANLPDALAAGDAEDGAGDDKELLAKVLIENL